MFKGCVICCAPYTLICAALLFVLHGMLKHGAWTFEVIATKEGWGRKEKADACLRAGIFYVFVSAFLWVLVVIHSLLIDLADLADWRRHYQGSVGGTIAYLYRRRQDYRERMKKFRAKQFEEQNAYYQEVQEMEARLASRSAGALSADDSGFARDESGDTFPNKPLTPKTPLMSSNRERSSDQ